MRKVLPDLAIPITPALERRLMKHAKEAEALHIGMLPIIFIETEIKNPDGTIVEKKKYKANSFNRNFYNELVGCFCSSYMSEGSTFGAGYLNAKDVGGIIRTISSVSALKVSPFIDSGSSSGYNLACLGSAGVDTVGIIVGSGTGEESYEGYVIGTKIAHGTSSGQLQYGLTAIGGNSAIYTAGTKTWSQTLYRPFTNASGSSITVNECALYQNGFGTSSTNKVMIERTKFALGKEVAHGQTLTITYTFSLTLPA